MGNTDRIIRIVVASLLAALYFTNTVAGIPGLALMILAVVFISTSFMSFCPLYHAFGIRTNYKREKGR